MRAGFFRQPARFKAQAGASAADRRCGPAALAI